MKVIDIHLHIGHLFQWSKNAVKLWMDTGKYRKIIFNEKGFLQIDEYVEVLKKEGVSGGIVLPEYSPLTAGVLPVEEAIKFQNKYPEFVALGAVNPNVHIDPLAEFKSQIKLGVKGLKLHSVHGLFYINDKKLYPVYSYCEENNIPIMMHAGTSIFRGTKLRYADPYTFDDVATDFPELTIILCHAGRGFWYHIAEFLIRRHKNVYIDISGLPPKNLLNYYPNMDRLSDKFIFGTDFPGVPGIAKNIKTIESLPISEKAKENIFYKNAIRVLKFWDI
jgi:predicted TIM-barrel fold metal-dependent hydrolase